MKGFRQNYGSAFRNYVDFDCRLHFVYATRETIKLSLSHVAYIVKKLLTYLAKSLQLSQ